MNLGIKGILFAVIGILLGAAGAWGFFQFQVATSKEQFFSGQWPRKSELTEQPSAVKLEVDGLSTRDVGKLLTGTKTTVDFLLRNPTEEKLKFQLAGALPAALSIDVPASGAVIAPKSTYPVSITVTPTIAENKFSKSIILQTEQGSKAVLTVNAQVEGGLGLISHELVFSRRELATVSVKDAELVCATSKDLKVLSIKLDGQATLPSWLTVEPIPMTDDLLSNNPGAKSGLVVRVTVSPDVPAEVKEAKLELTTDQTGYLPQIVSLKIQE